jgi:hypothetical protein
MDEKLKRKGEILKIVNSPGYMYSSDRQNGLTENGIDPELAPDILIESAMEKLTQFDALVLIHPDYLKTTKMKVYKKTLEGVVKKCLEIGKPVFCLQFDEKDDSGLDPMIFNQTIPFPRIAEENGFSQGALQEEVDYVSDILGKIPEQISLAWGGMLGDLCVTQWRDNRCLVTSPEFESISQHMGRKLSNPIAYGESLPEITVY